MTALRIWDFRRGDDDDNRTSPVGGGLRRVLISAALEFNYVKAADRLPDSGHRACPASGYHSINRSYLWAPEIRRSGFSRL